MTYLDTTSILNIDPVLLTIIVIWSTIWKGFALWKSATKRSPIWFIALLVINTVGLLEILYIFIFSKMGKPKGKAKNKATTKKLKKK